MSLSAELINMGYRTICVYSGALRFPRMIGKGFNGERLPGGPYLVVQFVGAGVLFFLASLTAYFIPIYNPLLNLAAGAVLALVVGSALAAVPTDGVNLISQTIWLAGLLVSNAPSASELMPTADPIALIGGDVMLLEPPRRQRQQPAPTQKAPARHQAPACEPTLPCTRPDPVTEPLTAAAAASSHAAAAVFGAFARTS
ncbi:hypothetical protein [Mycobacteroides abscessus]|uniref:hypothetical protein n=1 Tax=Mycobacteroides abscessus TaxID=36809 RepID=UPI0009A60A96|nr:hypothetical protein [Mycobacteroides abscessus]SKU60956.1 Uncharacterised protein [Mycobacteroides abscessus subsp. massiliense]